MIDSDLIYAPFTAEQVAFLAIWQERGIVHPFTCPNRSEDGHTWNERDLGVLTPTNDGWVCSGCDYTQDWAYEFMMSDPPTFDDLFGASLA